MVLLTALATGLLRQGAYFTPGQLAVGLFVAAALALALVACPLSDGDRRLAPVPCLFGLAGWALLVAALRGFPIRGLPPVLLVIGVVAVLVVCRRTSGADREILVIGIITTALLVGAAGWLGIAFRIGGWRWQAQGLWRASSTLTYPNATAAVLVAVVLLVIALLTDRDRSLPLRLAATSLLIGTGATLSRAGLIALAAGLVMLMLLLGVRMVLSVSIGPIVGSLVALIGLLPSMSATDGGSPALATITLLFGLLIGAGLAYMTPRRAVGAVSAVCLSGVLALVAAGPDHVAGAADKVASARLTVASADRFHGVQAALRTLADQPLTGAGSGIAEWHWTESNGVQGTLRYVHNEYVQLAAELGLVGIALLAAVLVSLGWLLWQARSAGAPRPLWAGVVAGICAFALHSGLDFVWHIPAIPLLMAALVGLVLPASTSESAPSTSQPFNLRGEIR
jgi:hypothetical protein